MNLKQIAKAKANNTPMVWNDPDPIEGNDYTITFIEDLSHFEDFSEEDMSGCPILIQYNDGMSEAEVWLNEIHLA